MLIITATCYHWSSALRVSLERLEENSPVLIVGVPLYLLVAEGKNKRKPICPLKVYFYEVKVYYDLKAYISEIRCKDTDGNTQQEQTVSWSNWESKLVRFV